MLHIWYVGCVRAVAPGVPHFIVINVYIPKYHMRGIKHHNALPWQAVDANWCGFVSELSGLSHKVLWIYDHYPYAPNGTWYIYLHGWLQFMLNVVNIQYGASGSRCFKCLHILVMSFKNDLKHLECRLKKAYHRVDHLPIPNSGPPCLINGCEGPLSFATRGHIPYAAPIITHQMGTHWVHQSSRKTYLNRRHIHLWLVNLPPANVPPSEIRPYDQGLWKQLVSLSKPLIRPYFWGGTLGGRFTSHEVYI